MLGICFFTLGQNTLKAPHLEGEKGKRGLTTLVPDAIKLANVMKAISFCERISMP